MYVLRGLGLPWVEVCCLPGCVCVVRVHVCGKGPALGWMGMVRGLPWVEVCGERPALDRDVLPALGCMCVLRGLGLPCGACVW